MHTAILDKTAMKQKKHHQRHDTDDDADDTLKNSSKICVDMNTVTSSVSTGSYDTTEDLTDTDASSQEKIARRSKNSNKNFDRKKIPVSKSSNIYVKGRKKIVGNVRFAMKANTMHDVESHEDFSAKERGDYWWSDREKDRMMAKHERLVAKYEQTRSATKPGTSKKTSQEKMGSYRGLESWTAAGSLKLDYTIEQCISAVMDEQDRQWNENDDDADIIAKKSQAVTEDSARRARLNGLQDAQEALKVRGESWSKKGGGDDISVGSAVSTGTAAIAKKKKRSKLLARLDDSHNNKISKSSDSSDNEDVLASLKKRSSRESKKDKKKKKKSSKKSLDEDMSISSTKTRKKKSKPKDDQTIQRQDSVDTTEKDQANSRTTKTTRSVAATAQDPPNTTADDIVSTSATTATPVSSKTVSSFCAGPSAPVSPLSTHVTSNHSTNTDEYPLLATLRRQQEQLRQSASREEDDTKLPIHQYRQHTVIEDDDDDGEETSDLLQTLRRQQRKQALTWQNQQQDGYSGGNNGMPLSSGGAVNKVSSLRIDPNKGGEEPVAAKFSDPPGRRPRRLASRHEGTTDRSVPENSSYSDKKSRSRSKSSERYERKNRSARSDSHSIGATSSDDISSPPGSPVIDEGSREMFGGSLLSPGAGKKSLKGLRNGAKTFFKRGSIK